MSILRRNRTKKASAPAEPVATPAEETTPATSAPESTPAPEATAPATETPATEATAAPAAETSDPAETTPPETDPPALPASGSDPELKTSVEELAKKVDGIVSSLHAADIAKQAAAWKASGCPQLKYCGKAVVFCYEIPLPGGPEYKTISDLGKVKPENLPSVKVGTSENGKFYSLPQEFADYYKAIYLEGKKPDSALW